VLSELALPLLLGDAGLGDVEPPGSLAVHDPELPAVPVLDSRRARPVARIDTLLVERRRLLDVRVGRDDPIRRHRGLRACHRTGRGAGRALLLRFVFRTPAGRPRLRMRPAPTTRTRV